MHFLNPMALLGLAAALIPLALHLLQRGRLRPLPFSNLAFLRRLHHHRMRRLRLRQWAVLLLRVLALALLALAFARPVHQAQGAGTAGKPGPTAAAVLLDRSYSTAYHPPSGLLFERLRQRAAQVLDLFSGRDEAALIPFASQPEPPADRGDPEQQRRLLEKLAPSEEAGDFRTALAAAAEYLGSRPDRNQEVFLCTDLARHNWAEVGDRRGWLPGATVYLTDPGVAERPNLHLDEVRATTWMLAPGHPLAVQVTLTNTSSQAAPGTAVDLYLEGERVHHQEVDLGPDETVHLEIPLTPRQSGFLSGYAQLEDDGLLLDNRRYFALDVPDSIRVLLLGQTATDTYYPRRALGASALADPVLQVRGALFSELDQALLDGVQVVLLCHPPPLPEPQLALLRAFAAGGGSLVLIPSPQADLNFYNRHLLPGLAPALFKDVVGRPGPGQGYQLLDRARPHHPLFQDLLSEDPADQPRFYASFELLPQGSLQPLIYFGDGRVALAEAVAERGHVLLFAAPLALDWTDLPLKGLFVPLLHRLVRHLSAPPGTGGDYLVGQEARRLLPGLSAGARVQAETPSGRRLLLEPELDAGQCYWKVPRMAESGVWRLWHEGRVVDCVPVNPDTRESVLTPLSREQLLQIFGAERTHFLGPDDDVREQVLGRRYGRELWQECLALALVLLLLELWLARAPQPPAAPAV